MDSVDRQVYFDDVKLQMEAKLWGMEYNRHNPPKKVSVTAITQSQEHMWPAWLAVKEAGVLIMTVIS